VSTLEALQAVLAGEHACVYGYGALGPHAGEQDRSTVNAAYDAHVFRRDMLTELIRARSAEPVAALPAYAVPFLVHDASSARRLAGLLEERLTVLYADLIAVSTNIALREASSGALLDTAVLAARWTGRTSPLPGIDPPEG
jgi:Domain of unknown function (DUF4439)